MILVGNSMLATDAADKDYQKHYHDLRARGLALSKVQHRIDTSLRSDRSVDAAKVTVPPTDDQ